MHIQAKWHQAPERHCRSKVCCPRTQQNVPSRQDSNPDCSIWREAPLNIRVIKILFLLTKGNLQLLTCYESSSRYFLYDRGPLSLWGFDLVCTLDELQKVGKYFTVHLWLQVLQVKQTVIKIYQGWYWQFLRLYTSLLIASNLIIMCNVISLISTLRS